MSKAVYALISQLVINSLILIILAVACNFLPDSPFKSYLNGGVLSALQPYIFQSTLPREERRCIYA